MPIELENSKKIMRFSRKQLLSMKRILCTFQRAARFYATNKSLRSWLQPALYIYRKLTGSAPQVQAILAPTYSCQCQCLHCYAKVNDSKGVPEMSTEEWKRAINQIKKMGILQILFTGGEPLLRADIFDLVAHAHNIGLLTRINTNGYLLSREYASEFKRAGLNQCGVSIDDAAPHVHDELRGMPGLYMRATQAIHHLNEVGIESKIMAYASHRNITDGLERIIELGRQLQVRSIFINIAFAAGRWASSSNEVLSQEEMTRVRELQDFTFINLEFPTQNTMCCAHNKSIVYINPWGEVTPCPIVPYSIGSLFEDTLADIWRRHVSSLRLKYRGGCPMNEEKARNEFRMHTTSVLAKKASGSTAIEAEKN